MWWSNGGGLYIPQHRGVGLTACPPSLTFGAMYPKIVIQRNRASKTVSEW